MRKLIVGVSASLAGGAIIALSCGGRIGYPGVLDDAGVYRLDGAFIFGPGSFCTSDAGAVYAGRPLCNDLAPDADVSAQNHACTLWLKANFPYQVTEGNCIRIDGAPSRCTTTALNDHPIMDCVPGSDSDAFCVAFFQQFVLSGQAVARCGPCELCAGGGTCQALSNTAECVCYGLTTSTRLCALRDGVTKCEDLCAR